MDSFKELTPEEIKLATIQFMGQHLTGDLKMLDQHITNKTTSLQGLTIDPVKIINTIPGYQNPVAAWYYTPSKSLCWIRMHQHWAGLYNQSNLL